jgi:hypothetical protein
MGSAETDRTFTPPRYEFKFVVSGIELSSELQEQLGKAVAEAGAGVMATVDTNGDRTAVTRAFFNPQPDPPGAAAGASAVQAFRAPAWQGGIWVALNKEVSLQADRQVQSAVNIG